MLSGGKVGIGTTSPSFKLDLVQKDSGVQLQIGRSNTGAGTAWMGADSNGFHLGVGAYGTGNSVSDPNGFTVDASGKVGIGTATPDATFHVKANDDSENALAFWVVNKAHNNSIISAYENGYVQIGQFTYNDATGNVGIGSLSPARALHLKNSNSAIAFETPIDANGSAFAQIKSGRDGSSGYSSTLEFATTESTTARSYFWG